MKKTYIYSFYFCLMGLLLSCSDSENIEYANLNEEFVLTESEEVFINGTNIKLNLDNITEGRCPTNVACIWQGQATAQITLLQNTTNLELNIKGLCEIDCGESKTEGNYIYTIKDIQPYPSENIIVTMEDYEVTLIVSKI